VALAGPAFAQPAPQPLTLLDVPFISQSEALCGGAAAAMILRFWGERGLTAESFAHLVDRSAAGIRTGALIAELRQRGWRATPVAGTAALLAAELDAGRPALTLIADRPGTFHYIVLVGATGSAVVFHDPARTPFRTMSRDEFDRRWRAADRWMAVVTPNPESQSPSPETQVPPNEHRASIPASCSVRVADAVAAAQAGDLQTAEQRLLAGLSCAGAARELAGVRLLQQRWPDVASLALLAAAEDPADVHAWRLLATSRFVQNQALDALAAWNRAGEPRLDRISVLGLIHTRQRTVEDLLGIANGALITPAGFTRAARRLAELPASTASRLEYVPIPGGLAELRASVVEPPVLPSTTWAYAGIAARAAVRREIDVSTGSLTGGGERLTLAWRFWPGRPRVALALTAPAPAWSHTGGTWAVDASIERQPFDALLDPARRSSAGFTAANWLTARLRIATRAGIDRWRGQGTFASVGFGARYLSSGERVEVQLDAGGWGGSGAEFATGGARATFRSTPARSGRVWLARAGVAGATSMTPADLWFGGDTGHVRDVLLRAHPLLDDAALRTQQLGRRIGHAAGEAQRWWAGPFGARFAAALFVDSAGVFDRAAVGSRGDIDAGLGARAAVPGLPGVFRLDLARGLRDGATALSFVYSSSP